MNPLCHRYLNQNILPFVGREAELRRLQNLFREFLEEGESKYTLISAESGGGKTRLVREFEEQLAEEYGETCIIVHARYLEGNVAALTPIINAFDACLAQHENLKQYLRSAGLLRQDHLAVGSGEDRLLGGILKREAGPPPLQVLLDSFNEIARRFPLVLILEDIHNMDDLPLFDQFFLGLSSSSKFVVLTERTGRSTNTSNGDSASPSGQRRSSEHLIREIALREERTSDVMNLTDFDSEEIVRLFQILFVLEPSAQMLEAVKARTDGRPLSLRTMLRQLVTMGALTYDHGHWAEDRTVVLDGVAADTGEQEVLARFQREIERLNEHEQLVAMHGALLGEQFDVRLLRSLIKHRLGERDISDELFQRAIDLLTFKSIIRRATPSISFSTSADSGNRQQSEIAGAWCYEFSHAHFWTTILQSARDAVAHEHDLITTIVWIAGQEHLPLYSSAFLTVTDPPYTLAKTPDVTKRVEHFLVWASHVVRSIWSQEPQQCLRLLLGMRPMRDEITWRFGPDLNEDAMGALIDLHSLLVEAFFRNGSTVEAERDLEHGAVLEKFIGSAAHYSVGFKGIVKGKIATLRALLFHSRTSYAEFERWSNEARAALEEVPESNLERARLLTLLARTKVQALLNTGRFKEADALIEQGMPIASLLADSRFDEYSLYYRVAVTSKLKQDQNEQAAELTSQIMALAKQHGNTLVETMFLFEAALASFGKGDIKAATQYCDLGIVNGRRYGIRFVEIMSYLWRMIIAGVQQEVEKIKECSQQLSILVEDARVVAQSPNLLQRISLIEGRATAMNFLGRYHAALEFADEAIQLAGSHQHDSFAAWAQNEKALALIGLGRFEEALSVAIACIQLAGENRLAERTARTAFIMAYAGLNRFEDARKEAELVRGDYRERNPYYLRFALAEARLLRLSQNRARSQAERQTLRAQLTARVEEMMDLADSWDAPLLVEQIRKEFEEVIPKRRAGEQTTQSILVTGSAIVNENSIKPTIRLYTFGSLLSEPIDERSKDIDESPDTKEVRSRDRDTKVRQLISLLVSARAEAMEARIGRTSKGAISRETLVDLLWPDSDSSNVLNALYTTIKRARAFLGGPDSILLNEDGYVLGPIVETDCEMIIRHYAESRQARKRNALFSITFHYEQILKLSDRGLFMEGIYGSWLDGLRTRLTTLRRTAAIRLIQTELDRGLLERVESICHKLLAQDEFDEEALRGLLIVSARRRQTTKLVRLFDDYSRKLKTEFRTDPSQELRTLYSSLTELASEQG